MEQRFELFPCIICVNSTHCLQSIKLGTKSIKNSKFHQYYSIWEYETQGELVKITSTVNKVQESVRKDVKLVSSPLLQFRLNQNTNWWRRLIVVSSKFSDRDSTWGIQAAFGQAELYDEIFADLLSAIFKILFG